MTEAPESSEQPENVAPFVADVAPPAVSPRAPVIVDDDDKDEERMEVSRQESLREQKREAAFVVEWTWHHWDEDQQAWVPYLLEPLSLDRWTWWHRMELHNAPLPRDAWDDPSAWSDAHVPTAWSLLFLCSHEPEVILALVAIPALYWQAVNDWAEHHCPGEFWAEALKQMREMEQTTKATIAAPRPTKKRGPRGNVPSP